MSFTTPIDIANRALQHVGAIRIASFNDVSKQAAEIGFCYDKLRKAELRRSVWRFAIKRAALRALTATTQRFVPTTWSSASVSYHIGNIVQDSTGTYWVAMIAHTSSNTNGPGSVQIGQPQIWEQYFGPVHGDQYSASVSYYAGELVYNSGNWYISVTNNNLNNTLGTNANWTQQGSPTALPVNFLVAAGPGVTIQNVTRNIFPLPNGYLRVTAQDPKVASTPTNVTSAGLKFSDWQFEGNYIVSASSGPLIIRFCADISDVTMFDDLFCEGLSARVGYEICETMTQSNIKLQAIAQAYQKFMADARNVNIIETGSTEPDEEQYLLSQGPAGVAESGPATPPQQGGR